ncbi:MAG: YcaO-like family protein, partial [Halobacteriaceae archaeon]
LQIQHTDRSLDESIQLAELGVDDKVGIISVIGERESYPTPYYLAQLSETESFSEQSAPKHAAGVAVDWDRAFMKGLGEAYERYCSGVYYTDRFTTTSITEITNPVRPNEFVRPSDADEITVNEDIHWTKGISLPDETVVHLPAELVYFPPPEERIRPAITTGLGLGNSTVEALLSGLYEIIERDAAMIAWYSTYEPLGLSITNEEFATLRRRARSEDLSVVAVLLTQDIDIPVVAVYVYRDEWPQFAAGSAAAPTAEQAALEGFEEAIQNWMELRTMGVEEAKNSDGAIGEYASFPRSVRHLVDIDATADASQIGTSLETKQSELEHVIDKIGAAELDIYATQITTRDVDSLGFNAVRTLIPDAQPLFIDEPYFGDRAKTVPRELGFSARLDRPFHPYP